MRGIFPHVAPCSVLHDKTRHREKGQFSLKKKKLKKSRGHGKNMDFMDQILKIWTFYGLHQKNGPSP